MSRSNDVGDTSRDVTEPGSADESVPLESGGDPACWAHLVCEKCGTVLEGSAHRDTCSALGD